MTTGNSIRRKRYEKRIRQKDLARLAGISNTYLCDIEAGRRRLIPAVADRLNAAYKQLLSERQRPA